MIGNMLIKKLEKYGYVERLNSAYNLAIYKPKKFEIKESDFNGIISKEDLKIFSDIYTLSFCHDKSNEWHVVNFIEEYKKEINRIADKITNSNDITDNEKCLFEKHLTSCFTHNLDISGYRLTIKKYFDNYFNKDVKDYSSDRLALSTLLFANLVLEEFNDKCEINFRCNITSNVGNMMGTSAISKYNYIIRFSSMLFMNMIEEFSKKEYIELLLYICYGILHESEHVRQFNRIFSDEKSEEIEIIKKEMILTNDTMFYEKYAINFLIERQANNYAMENLIDYYHRIMVKNNKAEIGFLKGISNQIKSKLINPTEFNNILNKRYNEFVNQDAEMSEHTNAIIENPSKYYAKK